MPCIRSTTHTLLVFGLVSALIWIGFLPPATNTQAQVNNPPIAQSDPARRFAVSPFVGRLYELNPLTYQSLGTSFERQITLSGRTVIGITGVATHPTTGLLYAITRVSGVSGRLLTILDPVTASMSEIGNLNDNFAHIAFTDTGVLYGVTGDGATVPETLYTIDPATAAKTLVTALGNGADGEVIGFNPDDGLMYHASGNSTPIFETVNLSTLVVTNIPRSGFVGAGEIFSLRYVGNNLFEATDISSRLLIISTTGIITNTGIALADDFRGIFFGGSTNYTATEDTELTVTDMPVLLNDYDADADLMTAIIERPPANAASFTLNANGTFNYTPAADYCGTDQFSYRASDGIAASNVATATIAIGCIPDAPEAADDAFSVPRNSANQILPVRSNDREVDGETLIITAVGTLNQGGVAIIDSGAIRYTPAVNFFGTEVFTYTVDDGTNRTASATVTVTVNAPPTADDDTFAVATNSQNNPLTVLVGDTDPENRPLSIAAVGTPNQGGTATINVASINYTPVPGFFGTDVFTYTVNDSSIGFATATVTVTVNAPPIADDETFTVLRNSQANRFPVLLGDTDPENSPLTIASVGQPAQGGTVVVSGTEILYTPAPQFRGTDVFTYTVFDGVIGYDTASVQVKVNAQPSADNETFTVLRNSRNNSFAVLVGDTDPESTILTISSISSPNQGGIVTHDGARIIYTPAPGFLGSESFTYTIRDADGGTATAQVTVTVQVGIFLPQILKQ